MKKLLLLFSIVPFVKFAHCPTWTITLSSQLDVDPFVSMYPLGSLPQRFIIIGGDIVN